MADIKPEIKLDPAAATASPMANIDDFEDDHDLQIPPPGPQAWLVKLPTHLWQAWAEIYKDVADDTPIEIGKMRVYNPKPGQTALQQRTQIRLNPNVPQHLDLPKNYELDIKTEDYSNVAVFTEKDLPGHQNRPGRKQHLTATSKPSGIPLKSERYGQASTSGRGYYRSSIPKQTALAPLIHHVADAAPVQDESYDKHFAKTYASALKPKKTTRFQPGIDRTLHPGTAANLANFSSFGLTSRPAGGRKPPPKEKAVRMSQEDLLDRLYQCFRRYRYWSLKALKNELKQPETYIKQTLESIAVLVRSGDFAMNYKLKDEYASMANNEDVKEETALIKSEDDGSAAEDADMEEMDDDAEDDFEDVKMEE